MSQQNNPRPTKSQQEKLTRSTSPTPDDTFMLGNPSPNPQMNLLQPQTYYYNQPYPNQPYQNPTPTPEPYAFSQFSQANAFHDFSSQPSAFPFSHPNYVSQTQMGGSSSQTCTDPPMSHIHAFSIEDMYTLEFLDFFQQNTGSFQETAREDSPDEVATSPPKTKVGNTRKHAGFWIEVLQYMQRKTKQYGRRTYDMMNEKWKTVRPAVVRFCGVYGNVMRRLQESGASNEYYYARAVVDYEAETVTTFKLRNCWEIVKDSLKWMQSEVSNFAGKSREGSKRYKTSRSSSFNIESREASINLNVDVGDYEKDKVPKIRRLVGRDKVKDSAKKKGSRASGPSSMNDEALARLIVSEIVTQDECAIEMQKEERLAFLDIKRREV
nr:hypothetical protein [Tanacetum cinerariifolium]